METEQMEIILEDRDIGMEIKMKIKDKKSGKVYTEEDLALLFAKEGKHIVYCDLEGIAVLEKDGNKDYYLIDECGNAVWIDERFEIERSKIGN